jgi:DNA-binding XRE family transcriptional regulator
MAKKLEQLLADLPAQRRVAVEARAGNLATLKDLRQAVEQTQQDLAATLGVGQDTISRLEKRSDMLLSTLRRYVEAMGGSLELVAQFPNRPPVVIHHLAPMSGDRSAKQSNVGA